MVFGDFLIKPALYLNLFLVTLVIIWFIRMFRREAHEKVYKLPWVLLFIGILIFVLETVLTILRHTGLITFIHEGNYLVYNGFFEMGIITLFTYMLLLQREHVKKEGF